MLFEELYEKFGEHDSDVRWMDGWMDGRTQSWDCSSHSG
jgi:hypothetical protein